MRKECYDAKGRNHSFKTGDLVYVYVGQTKVGERSKLPPRWVGSCVVQQIEVVQITALTPSGRAKKLHHNKLSAPVRGECNHVLAGARGWPRKIPQPTTQGRRQTGSHSSAREDDHNGADANVAAKQPTAPESPTLLPPTALPDSGEGSICAAEPSAAIPDATATDMDVEDECDQRLGTASAAIEYDENNEHRADGPVKITSAGCTRD